MDSQKMKTFAGGVVAGVALAVIGSFWSGFVVTSGTASEQASNAASAATVAALTPACVKRGLADTEQLATIKEASSYKRRDMVSDAGWVTAPEGADYSLKRSLASACAERLIAAAE